MMYLLNFPNFWIKVGTIDLEPVNTLKQKKIIRKKEELVRVVRNVVMNIESSENPKPVKIPEELALKEKDKCVCEVPSMITDFEPHVKTEAQTH